MMAFKIEVDAEACIGCESCVGICDNFEMKDGKAVPKAEQVDEVGTNQDAADACPVDCIKITEV